MPGPSRPARRVLEHAPEVRWASPHDLEDLINFKCRQHRTRAPKYIVRAQQLVRQAGRLLRDDDADDLHILVARDLGSGELLAVSVFEHIDHDTCRRVVFALATDAQRAYVEPGDESLSAISLQASLDAAEALGYTVAYTQIHEDNIRMLSLAERFEYEEDLESGSTDDGYRSSVVSLASE